MKFGKFVVNFLRKRLIKGNNFRRKFYPSLTTFEGLIDVPYIDDGINNHKFDIFYAKEKNRNNICIIDIHGGAYVFGEHRDNYEFGYQFLKKGFDFIEIDYIPNNGRLDTKYSIDDCVRCINHIFRHLDEYKLNNDKFVLMGDSAGGHFALLIAEAINNKDVADKLGYEFNDIKIELLLVNSPVYDVWTVGDEMLNNSGKRRLFGPRFNDENVMKLISPNTYLENFNISFFVSTCKKDFLREQSIKLKEDAEKFNKDFTFLDINSDSRNVSHVHNVVNPKLKESITVNNAMMDFILNKIK